MQAPDCQRHTSSQVPIPSKTRLYTLETMLLLLSNEVTLSFLHVSCNLKHVPNSYELVDKM